MQKFITNKNNTLPLSAVLNDTLKNTSNAAFLVGYFYFSGFKELYTELKDKSLRVLVGLEVQKDIFGRVSELDYIVKNNSKEQTKEEIIQNYCATLRNIFNDTELFDNAESTEAFNVYYNKIKDGTLQIRKTKEANHAKMYLFEWNTEKQNIMEKGALITGSSNLSYAGLTGRQELNVYINDSTYFEEGLSIFNELWETATILVDKDHTEHFENDVIKKIWWQKEYSPYCFFLKTLDEYFSIDYNKYFRSAAEITKGEFTDLKYQTDAIKIALNTIQNHNGVIISDVVGLGKSIIASVIANNLGLRTIIICPPHLKTQWDDYRTEFTFYGEAFSSGSIERALNWYNEKNRANERWLIIIDEAHKYRNENTKDYDMLLQLCRGNKVVLLTATPFNNHPADIFSMLKLFQLPAKPTLQVEQNLAALFSDLESKYKKLRKNTPPSRLQ